MATMQPQRSHASEWHGVRRDAIWQIAERATRVGCGFLLSILIARVLGPGLFGIYSYALAIAALFAFLGQAGIDSLLIRELIRHSHHASRLLSESIALRLIGSILAGIASVATAAVASTAALAPSTTLVAVLALSGVFQSSWVIESWLQSQRRFRHASLAKITAYVIASVLRLVALASPHPLWALACATVLESAIAAVLLWIAATREPPFKITHLAIPSANGLTNLAKLASPMLLSALMVAIYSRVDVFMLGHMLGGKDAGLYTAATLLSEGFYVIPMAIMAAAAPRLVNLYTRNMDEFYNDLYATVRLLSATGLMIAILVTIAAPFLVVPIFGAQYVHAALILQIHVWSTWAVFISAASDPWYINNDLRTLYFLKNMFAAALNISLNIIMIPSYRGAGAALATVVAYTASAVLFGSMFSATRPLFLLQLRAIACIPPKHPVARESV